MNCELTILMPCLNEAETLKTCIKKAREYLERSHIQGEIVVADNGSKDGSQDIAVENGARVIDVPVLGYGAALTAGIQGANGKFVIMGDSDDSYDFSNLDLFVKRLRDGYDLVLGNRFKGGIEPGAMPWLHKYIGNPILSLVGRVFFGSPVSDFHCGLRGFKRESILKLGLSTTGMEFASEMVVKATLGDLRITEVPTTLSQDGRSHPPHLRSWNDGWRHLRFLLMYSPRWLFLFPGLILSISGILVMFILLPGPIQLGPVTFDVHSLMIAATALILGVQTLCFALLAKQFGVNQKFLPPGKNFLQFREHVTLERFLVCGIGLILIGLGGVGLAILKWGTAGFGDLVYSEMMRVVIPSATVLIVGIQLVLTGFLSSILDLKN